MVGPGKFPFTVTMGLVEHNLVAFFITTWININNITLSTLMVVK